MTRAVVDTNVAFSAARGGLTAAVLRRWRAGEFVLCVSEPILEEYERVLTEKGLARELAELLQDIRAGRHCLNAETTPALPGVVRDKTDVKFVECAAALNADFIVSGDKHLRELKQWGDARVLTPADFLKELDARRG